MKKLIVFLLTVLSLTARTQNAQNIDLQYVADTFMRNHQIPAVAIAVIRLDTLMCAVSGVNKLSNRSQFVQLTSKFHLGSNSKAITGFMAAKLVEQGKIAWETKLIEVLPQLKWAMNVKFQDITLAQLLSHTAGIQAYSTGSEFLVLPNFQGNTTQQRLAFAAHTLKFDTLLKVGDYAYSNAGYGLAAAMLEQITQKSWEELLKQTLTDVKTPNFYVGFPNRESMNNPSGHSFKGPDTLEEVTPDDAYKIESIIAPAGDVSMNIVDYSRFIQLNLQGICGADNYLTSKSYEKIHFGKEKYAFGWGNGRNAGGLVSTHSGSVGNFYCHTMLFKEKKMAIIVMANASSPKIDKAVVQMRRNLFDLYNLLK